MTQLHEAEGLTAADVMHRRLTTLPASTTVAEIRDYFAESGSRRLAMLVDGDRYVGSIAVTAVPDGADPGDRAADYVADEPTVGPDAPATAARDLAIGLESRRVPVIDESGALMGVVAVDRDHTRFCGT